MKQTTEQTTDARRKHYLQVKRALFDKAYGFLNEKQREAVFSDLNAPLLVLAGAGSGKTTVLVNRIAYFLKYGNAYVDEQLPNGITEKEIAVLESMLDAPKDQIENVLPQFACNPLKPWSILSITFTNKAANEMKERLAKTVGEDAKEIWSGTFHSVCARILRRYGDRMGYTSDFTIYDTEDVKKQITACLKALSIDEKLLPPKTVMSEISKAKNELQSPKEFAKKASEDFRLGQIAAVYERYQENLARSNAMDFDDLIGKAVELFETQPDVLEKLSRQFSYVAVDEYQDTNHAQFRLAELLSGHYQNLMVVGDDDQSIYKFRGATIENILQFDRVFPQAHVVRLEQNYRSTKMILAAANAVIAHNTGRHEKSLWTENPEGEKVVVRCKSTQDDEARFISGRIMTEVSNGKHKYSDYAILYRVNAQSNALEKVFSRTGVPYRMLGGVRFYERKEVKDMLAYLCLIHNPNDNLRLRRIINEPKRKIGETTLSAVEALAEAEHKSMLGIIQEADAYPALQRVYSNLLSFARIMDELTDLAKSETLSDLFRAVYERTGYKEMLEKAGLLEIDRTQNVEELISNAVEYEQEHPDATLGGFLEEVALVSDIDQYDEEANAVVMMTIHSAKGLEFPVVFLPGMEEGIFPGRMSAVDPVELEEERRLAYVAMTRAKEKLYCLRAHERLLYGQTQYNPPSRFLKEIPPEYADVEDLNRKRQVRAEDGSKPRRRLLSEEFCKNPLDTAAKAAQIPTAPTRSYRVGERVCHATFGIGVILSARKIGNDTLYEIEFVGGNVKKLMGNYAKLTPGI